MKQLFSHYYSWNGFANLNTFSHAKNYLKKENTISNVQHIGESTNEQTLLPIDKRHATSSPNAMHTPNSS